MNKVHAPLPRPFTAPDVSRNLSLCLWPFTLAICAALHFGLWRPGQLLASFGVDAPPVGLGLICAAVLGLGLAVLMALIWENRRNWRAVLRPTRGKLLGAVVMMVLTPFAVMNGLPWILGGLTVMAVLMLETFGAEHLLRIAAIWGACMIVWYPVCALIVSGTRSVRTRYSLLLLMLAGCYSAHILYTGLQKFTL